MERLATIRRRLLGRKLYQDKSGQSLVEVAVMVPLFTLLVAYALDFGYFFLAAANISSAARNAVQYSILGYEGPAQTGVPAAGPTSAVSTVSSMALADLTSLTGSSTTTTVEVCTKANGIASNLAKCTSYLNGATQGTNTYAATLDPEAPRFVLHRVDVTYTVQPPIPLSVFATSILPTLVFHRQVSMRAMD